MSKNSRKNSSIKIPNQQKHSIPNPPFVSLLDAMKDGREFESLCSLRKVNVNPVLEIRRAIKEISDIRKRPVVAYLANVVNANI